MGWWEVIWGVLRNDESQGKASEESILARYDDDPERQAITHYEAASQVYIREASLATRP